MVQGHFRPFLSLAWLIKRWQPGGFTITLLTTPLNALTLRSSVLSPEGSDNVLLREIHFRSADHGLPPDIENTDSLRGPDIIRFCHASESLRPHFERFVSDVNRRDERPQACIIADVFFEWTIEVAREADVFFCTITTCGAYGTAAMSQYMCTADGDDPWSTFLWRYFVLSLQFNVMLCNTVEELETALRIKLMLDKGLGRALALIVWMGRQPDLGGIVFQLAEEAKELRYSASKVDIEDDSAGAEDDEESEEV
ncbi:hypothetical protein Taro_031710 [Colocasia esculenta]|uniref:Uncharacterized protein n=1 Tax=Colocasia esculenta TaxID=4460 RepID=A0A843VXC8_COLES|nr:hypothetical protein [Colocasia esculenta]